jgi:hypothetical protein
LKSKKVCDGSVVKWTPVMEDTECDCCGSVTGQYDTAVPDFHGRYVKRDGSRFCERCGDEQPYLDQVLNRVFEDSVKAMVDSWERSSKFYQMLQDGATFKSEGGEIRWPLRLKGGAA